MSDRKEELKKALGYKEDEPSEGKGSSLEKGRVYGKGKLRTRVNWGFWVLFGAFLLFVVTWFVLRPMGVFD